MGIMIASISRTLVRLDMVGASPKFLRGSDSSDVPAVLPFAHEERDAILWTFITFLLMTLLLQLGFGCARPTPGLASPLPLLWR